MKDTIIAAFAFAVGVSTLPAGVLHQASQPPITTETLVREMVDLEGLTRFPDPPFRTVQFSSYDRRSDLPGGPGWFANADGFGKEPIPGFLETLESPDQSGAGKYLMAEVAGPGAIVRFWTAGITGRLSLFLDGSSEPLYDGPAEVFFRSPYSVFPTSPGLAADRMAGTLYQRDASYTPIPFQKSMRLVWTGDLSTLHFYHVQVRTYRGGTRVETFSPADLTRYRDAITETMGKLDDPDSISPPKEAETAQSWEGSLGPGERREGLALAGPGALTRLTVKVKALDMNRALRQILLQIVSDDFPEAQVESPLGDFFGAAPGINPYQSLPFSVEADGTMVCRFMMPFQSSLNLRLSNLGDQPVSVRIDAGTAPYRWDPERSMHFRARWRVDHRLIASNKEVQDLPFLLAEGKGVAVGTVSYVVNPNPIPTSYGNWWGEGDEKVFVDDDVLPSTFGTGSEDYYNYSWSSPDIFDFPYCGQPRNDGPGNRGYVTNQRWQILDSLPFSRRLSFYMELYSHETTPEVSYARMVYHYAKPGLMDDHLTPRPSDLYVPDLPESFVPAARMGAAGAIFHPAETLLKSERATSVESGRIWEGGRLLVWHPARSGDRVELQLTVPSAGKYRVHLVAALSPGSGTVRPTFKTGGAGGEQSEPLDLFRPFRTLSRDFTVYEGPLDAGAHGLELDFVESGPGVGSPVVGLDFLWIQPLRD